MASEIAKSLRDRRQKAWYEARAILDNSTARGRDLTATEKLKWETLNSEMDQIDERLKAVLGAEKRTRETDEAYNNFAGRKVNRTALNSEIRDWILGRDSRREIEVRKNGPVNPRYLNSPEFRTLLTNSGSASATVPVDFFDRLVAYLIEVSGLLQAGPSVINTQGGETLQIPVASNHVAATSAAQGQTLPTADPSFTQAALKANKFGVLLQLSRELLDDTAIDLEGYLAMSAGRAVGNVVGNSLINQLNGVTTGVLAGATVAVTGSAVTGVKGAPTYNNLVDLQYSVIAPYRQSRSCYWIAADTTIGALRKIVDNNNRPIWEPSAVLGAPDLLLGKPLVADPFMPLLGATGRKALAFGDFSQYFVRLAGGLRFERSDDFQFGSDLVVFRALLRADGNYGDSSAVVTYQTGAAT